MAALGSQEIRQLALLVDIEEVTSGVALDGNNVGGELVVVS